MKKQLPTNVARLAALLGATLMAGVCLADNGPSYTYGELGYTRLDIEDFDADGDMLGIGGSMAVADQFHIFASYDDGEVDPDFGPEIDVTLLEVGGGINYAVSDTVDLVGRLSWVSAELDAGGFGDVDDDGLGLFGGMRAMMNLQLELNGGIGYTDIEDNDEASLDIGAVYSFTETFAVTADASFADDVSSYGIGLRMYFDL